MSTKENSPICARLSPTMIDSRSGYLRVCPTPAVIRAFTPMTAVTSMEIQRMCAVRYLKSRSMPMEMKKRLENVSLKGMTSATIWLLYSDSEMASPATNAPRARERPSREVTHAVPRQTRTIVRMNTSLFLSFTTW